jgi:hypothetical protein
LSPTLIGAFIGVIVFYSYQNIYGLTIAIVIFIAGIVIGIKWATNVWRKSSTEEYLSRVSATPDLDNLEKSEKKSSI